MFRIIKSYTDYNYDIYNKDTTINYNGCQFSVHLHSMDDMAYFSIEIFQIHPYSDPYNYAYAKMKPGGNVQIIQNNQIIHTIRLHAYDFKKYKSSYDYIDEVINIICEELIQVNNFI